jgi:hypothetical protein
MTVSDFLDKKTINKINKISKNAKDVEHNGYVRISAETYCNHVEAMLLIFDELVEKLGERMGLGMLWNFADKKSETLEQHLERAMEVYNQRHKEKFGEANKCHVNSFHTKNVPEDIAQKDGGLIILGLRIIFDNSIGKYHLWIK